MILQTIRNECIRFGGHVDIEVSYKILWLETTFVFSIFERHQIGDNW
jgi:hypothetical protein